MQTAIRMSSDLPTSAMTPLENQFKGYTIEEHNKLIGFITEKSDKLYTNLQVLQAKLKKDVESAVKSKKGILRIPVKSKAFLLAPKYMEKPENPEPMSSKLNSEPEQFFTEEKLKLYLAPLAAGWKREVVKRSSGCTTPGKRGNVYYYSPQGIKFRTCKEVGEYLHKNKLPFTVDNFSFAVIGIGACSHQEIVRVAYERGKNPSKKIRSLEKPSGKGSIKLTCKPEMETKQEEKLVKKMLPAPKSDQLPDPARHLNAAVKPMPMTTFKKIVVKKRKPYPNPKPIRQTSLIKYTNLCSVTCPGFAGSVPDLQCSNCFCLFHPKCLGFLPNYRSQRFVCPNCQDSQSQYHPNKATSIWRKLHPMSPTGSLSIIPLPKNSALTQRPSAPSSSLYLPKLKRIPVGVVLPNRPAKANGAASTQLPYLSSGKQEKAPLHPILRVVSSHAPLSPPPNRSISFISHYPQGVMIPTGKESDLVLPERSSATDGRSIAFEFYEDDESNNDFNADVNPICDEFNN